MANFSYGRVECLDHNTPVIEVIIPDDPKKDRFVRVVIASDHARPCTGLAGISANMDGNEEVYKRCLMSFTKSPASGSIPQVAWFYIGRCSNHELYAARTIISIAFAGAFGLLHEEARRILVKF